MDYKSTKEDTSNGVVVMDRIYVDHKFGDAAAAKLGRYEVDAGGFNTWLISATFQGAEADFNLSKDVALGVGYGRFSTDSVIGGGDANYNDAEFFYAQAKANLGAAKLGVDYFRANDGKDGKGLVPVASVEGKEYDKYEVIGANLVVPVGDFRVTGDYYTNTAAKGDPQVWAAGLGYGAVNAKKPGSWGIDVAYFDVEKGVAPDGLGGWQLANAKLLEKDGSFWYASADVALQKNVTLHGEYAFAADADKGVDPDDQYTVSLNYKF